MTARAKPDTRAKPAAGAPRRRGEARGRILEAALALFADQGYDAISTTDIARRAGCAQSVVLYHFANKDNLWRAAMTHLFARLEAQPAMDRSAYQDLDVATRLRVLLRQFVATAARHPELGRVIFREGASGGPRLEWIVRELAAPRYALFETLFREGARQGLFKDYPPALLTLMVQGAAATLFNLSPLGALLAGRDPFDPAVIERQTEMVLDILLTGLAAPG